jgi:hypothetical protein
MKFRALPPVELLRRLLDYNPESGKFTWKEDRRVTNNTNLIGKEAGYKTPKGYILISVTIDGKPRNLSAQRVAYYMYHLIDPLHLEVDHINRVRDDNSITNLRLVTTTEQAKNRDLNNAKQAVKITYPDGRGEVIVDSLKTAAKLLNRGTRGIAYTLNHTGVIYWGWGGARLDSGIRVKRVSMK